MKSQRTFIITRNPSATVSPTVSHTAMVQHLYYFNFFHIIYTYMYIRQQQQRHLPSVLWVWMCVGVARLSCDVYLCELVNCARTPIIMNVVYSRMCGCMHMNYYICAIPPLRERARIWVARVRVSTHDRAGAGAVCAYVSFVCVH